MRLTLRTLLAYLDDILPPAETKELGEKIAASPVASQLVDRVRDVMRRRRLTAPEPDGSGGGIEPNLVAEYLDNNLPPEKVADVERVCLESDVNLAEVAACHQVLTLVLGEPVEISGHLRERMYALGPQGTPLDVPEPSASKRVGEATAREQLAAIQAAQRPKPVPAAEPLESRLPEYLRPKPLWKRVLPWAAVAAVLLVWLGLLAYDPTFFGARDADDAEGGRVAEDETPEEREVAAVETEPPRGRQPEPAGPSDADAAPTVAAATLPDLPVDPEPPADEVRIMDDAPPASTEAEGPAVAAAATATATPTGDATPDSPEPAGPPAATTEAPPTGTATPAPAGPPAIDIVSTTGIVLRYDPQAEQWYPVPSGEDPPAGVPIAVPEPFEAQLAVAGLPLRITALGGTRFETIGQTPAGPVGLDVAQGRLRFAADTAQPTDAATMLALRLGQGLWRVEPLTPDTTFGIEALPLQPTAPGQDLSGRTPQGVVYVATGAVRVADAAGRVEVASAGNRLILTPDGGGIGAPSGPVAAPAEATVAEEVPADAEPEPASEPEGEAVATDAEATEEEATETETTEAEPTETESADFAGTAPTGVPDWMFPREPTSAARRAMVAFQKEFVPGIPAGQSMLPAVDNPLFYVAEPAAKALGLIEDVDGLVKTLRDAESQEAVLAAIEGLRNWLGRSPTHGEPLRQQLDLVFAREGLAETLDRLLWGYGRDDARDEATARQLVEWLDHPEPIVRALAFYHIKRLSGGRTMYYHPNQTPGDRIGPLNRWRDFVNRNGGLVVRE